VNKVRENINFAAGMS